MRGPDDQQDHRCHRHAVGADQYSPSRRNSAAIPPGLHASASRRILSFYSAVCCRRIGFTGTSGSGTRPLRPGIRTAAGLEVPALRCFLLIYLRLSHYLSPAQFLW
jgi:hypothetical protein